MKFRVSSARNVMCVRVYVRETTASSVTPKLRGGRTLISKMGVAETNEGVVAAVAQGMF
jgi:hypothetical protein